VADSGAEIAMTGVEVSVPKVDAVRAADRGSSWRSAPGLVAWPHQWQRPARTEEWAWEQALAALGTPRFAQLVCFPWATLIDMLDRGLEASVRPALAALAHAPPRTTLIRATVCQHIRAPRAWRWMRELGITDVFWSHARIDEPSCEGIRIHAFPLYPVRCLEHPNRSPPLDASPAERRLLYSFVGAYSPEGYLTPVRQWLFDLPARRDAVVVRRSEWHYEADVYRAQVAGHALALEELARRDRHGNDYDATLRDSIFSLCPSGSGPNSIRLWESLGFGCIPVLLADSLLLPGSPDEWAEAIVRIPETRAAISALPAQLDALARDRQRLQRMQEAGRRLWARYGEHGPRTVLAVLSDPGWVRAQVATFNGSKSGGTIG
jgi:hypothetical protein